MNECEMDLAIRTQIALTNSHSINWTHAIYTFPIKFHFITILVNCNFLLYNVRQWSSNFFKTIVFFVQKPNGYRYHH